MQREIELAAAVQLLNVFSRFCRRDGAPGTRAGKNREWPLNPPARSPNACKISGVSSGGARSGPACLAKMTRVVASGPPFSPHNISSTMSAKKNNRPRFGSVGAPGALWGGVGGKLDKSICDKKWRGVPV
jgi:hypothetical protein